jgi:ribosomal protein S18 acetylase RimI-like enzyme
MSEIKIRKPLQNDVDEIAHVLLDFYNIEDHQEAKKVFIDEQKKDFHYLLAVEDDKVLGLVTWINHGLPKHGLFELDRICIMTNARGRGIGKKLVTALIDDAQNWFKKRNGEARKLYLLTHEDNNNAHIFYEKVGFIHETTLKSHYYNGQDERVYSIFLKD